MFEKASRLKLRFDTPLGKLSAEDLWDLPLSAPAGKANLDDLAKALDKQLKDAGSAKSFVTKAKPEDEVAQLRFDLVLHVIQTKLAENAAAAKARETAEEKQQILGIIAEKEKEALKGKSVSELRKMVGKM